MYLLGVDAVGSVTNVNASSLSATSSGSFFYADMDTQLTEFKFCVVQSLTGMTGLDFTRATGSVSNVDFLQNTCTTALLVARDTSHKMTVTFCHFVGTTGNLIQGSPSAIANYYTISDCTYEGSLPGRAPEANFIEKATRNFLSPFNTLCLPPPQTPSPSPSSTPPSATNTLPFTLAFRHFRKRFVPMRLVVFVVPFVLSGGF
jgi:hypothetical protein